MKTVFRAGDILEAHIVCNMLRAEGIDATINGQYQQGGVGELMPFDFARVQVAEDDIAAAQWLIEQYEKPINESNENGSRAEQTTRSHLITWIVPCCLILLAIAFFSLRGA